jgi:hypothetical protein
LQMDFCQSTHHLPGKCLTIIACPRSWRIRMKSREIRY